MNACETISHVCEDCQSVQQLLPPQGRELLEQRLKHQKRLCPAWAREGEFAGWVDQICADLRRHFTPAVPGLPVYLTAFVETAEAPPGRIRHWVRLFVERNGRATDVSRLVALAGGFSVDGRGRVVVFGSHKLIGLTVELPLLEVLYGPSHLWDFHWRPVRVIVV
jgi:hypothetical protein